MALLSLATGLRTFAITDNELLPASLIGTTLTFTQATTTPNTLEPGVNSYTIQFTSSTGFTRITPAFQTTGGYVFLETRIGGTGARVTVFRITDNWYAAGSVIAILLTLTHKDGVGEFSAVESVNNPLTSSNGTYTLSGVVSTPAPVITSATSVTTTVGTPFSYRITSDPPVTFFTNKGGTAPVGISQNSGLVTGTFTTAGTFFFSFTASNAGGTSPETIVTVTVTGSGPPPPLITSETSANGIIRTAFIYQIVATNSPTSYAATDLPAGVSVNSTTGLISGTPVISGTYRATISATNAFGIATERLTITIAAAVTTPPPVITSQTSAGGNIDTVFRYQIVATNSPTSYAATGLPTGVSVNSTTGLISGTPDISGTYLATITATNAFGTATGRLTITISTGVTTLTTNPTNLVGYRNKVGQTFQFTITGTVESVVWGTDFYTDDSPVARAAVHAGVVAVGETKTITITLLGRQTSFAATTRNGVTSVSWRDWPGSFTFAGTTGAPVTAKPTLISGFPAGTTIPVAVGGRFVCPVAVTGGGTYTYQWYRNNAAIGGATQNPYVVDSVTPNNNGAYMVDVTNSLETTRIVRDSLNVLVAGSPVITLQPTSKISMPGATVGFVTSGTGLNLSYQWLHNNIALAGETGAVLLRTNVSATDAGTYSVRISNGSANTTSVGATLTISANASRAANIAVRTNVPTGTTVIPGFVIQGTGTKRVLIRAVGPGLAAFGLTGVMSDPKFSVFQGSTQIASNDNWSTTNIGTAFSVVGAFPISADSKDAALITDLSAGRDYTVQVTNASGVGGIVLIEVYAVDGLTGTSKFVNVSVRGQTAPGANLLTLGLVIGGTGQRTLLVRGIGPALAAFGVTGTVADPRIQIYDGQGRAILANDNWGNADFVSEVSTATNYVGAFILAGGSRDAATLCLVDPGAYTIQVSGAATAPTGEALVEVYEVP